MCGVLSPSQRKSGLIHHAYFSMDLLSGEALRVVLSTKLVETVSNNEYPFTAPISLFASRTGEESGNKNFTSPTANAKAKPKAAVAASWRSRHGGGLSASAAPRHGALAVAAHGTDLECDLNCERAHGLLCGHGFPVCVRGSELQRNLLRQQGRRGHHEWLRRLDPELSPSTAPPGHDGGGPNRQPQLTAATTADLPPPSPGASEESDIAPQDSSLQPCTDACSTSVAYASSRSRIWVRGERRPTEDAYLSSLSPTMQIWVLDCLLCWMACFACARPKIGLGRYLGSLLETVYKLDNGANSIYLPLRHRDLRAAV